MPTNVLVCHNESRFTRTAFPCEWAYARAIAAHNSDVVTALTQMDANSHPKCLAWFFDSFFPSTEWSRRQPRVVVGYPKGGKSVKIRLAASTWQRQRMRGNSTILRPLTGPPRAIRLEILSRGGRRVHGDEDPDRRGR